MSKLIFTDDNGIEQVIDLVALGGAEDGNGKPAGNIIIAKGTERLTGTITGTGVSSSSVSDFSVETSYQITANGTHAGTTIVDVEVSNDNVGWKTIGTLSVTGASAVDSISPQTRYKYVQYNCTSFGSAGSVAFTMLG